MHYQSCGRYTFICFDKITFLACRALWNVRAIRVFRVGIVYPSFVHDLAVDIGVHV